MTTIKNRACDWLQFCGLPDYRIMGSSMIYLSPDVRRIATDQWLLGAGQSTHVMLERDGYDYDQELTWVEEKQGYGHFDAYVGWIMVDDKDIKLYRINVPGLMATLQQVLGMPGSTKAKETHENLLWDLGDVRVEGKMCHVYFVNYLFGRASERALRDAMRLATTKYPIVVLHPGNHVTEDDLELPLGTVMVPVNRIFNDSAELELDSLALAAMIREGTGGSIECQSDANTPRFSTDYRLVHWQAEQYRLTKKQAAVFEALDREGGRAHKDLLRAEAQTNEELHRIMRNKVDGKWVPHPLWKYLVISDGNGQYQLRTTFEHAERIQHS